MYGKRMFATGILNLKPLSHYLFIYRPWYIIYYNISRHTYRRTVPDYETMKTIRPGKTI